MKVCFVTTSFIRSPEDHYARFVFEQARSLRLVDHGIEVLAVAPHAAGLAVEESIDGVTVHRVRYFWPTALERLAYQHEGLFQTLRTSWLAVLQLPLLLTALLIRLLRVSRNAQIIHAQWIPTAAVAIIVGALRRVPVVVSVRGGDLNTARGSRLGRLFTSAILGRVTHIVTVSDDFRSAVANEIGCHTPVSALYNGVDTEQFHPRDKAACRRELGLDETGSLALYVGGLIERKGLKTLLEALTDRHVTECHVELYLAGEGPQLDKLKAVVSANGLAQRVRFLGKVPRNRVHLWMNAADVLVLPSYSEGRPNVILEAMASGTPVVATAVGGTTELVADGENGLLFTAGDVAALSSCLTKVLRNPDLATALARGGPETIRSLGLSWQSHGLELLSLYNHLAGGR